jgi:salicylate hydroxylase
VGRTSTGRQVIHFADHTTYEADLVIGADGIKSVVRNAVVSDGHPVFSNTYAYRGLIPMDTLKSAGLKAEVESSPHNWVGLGSVRISFTWDFEPKLIFDPIKHIITFTVKGKTLVCV